MTSGSVLVAVTSRAAVASALIATAACAPLGELRPASGMMPGRTYEVGAGAVRLGPRPYVTESAAGTGQLWFSANASELWTLSAIGAFDLHSAAGGGALRFNAARYRTFRGGVEVQAGWAWGAFTLPLAVRLFDETWIYASPRLGTMSRYPSFGLPVGLSARVYDGFALRAEVQTSWEDFDPYQRRVHLAAGAAYQW